jgi:hypothetical protein
MHGFFKVVVFVLLEMFEGMIKWITGVVKSYY